MRIRHSFSRPMHKSLGKFFYATKKQIIDRPPLSTSQSRTPIFAYWCSISREWLSESVSEVVNCKVFRHSKPRLVLCSKQTIRLAETDRVICFSQSHGLFTTKCKFSFTMSNHLMQSTQQGTFDSIANTVAAYAKILTWCSFL